MDIPTVCSNLKSINQQTDSSRFWFEKLKYGLEEHIFEPSDYDPCMFVYDKFICLVYVDDCIWFSKYRKYIGEVMNYSQNKVSKYNWEIT